jgi:hypothetical protein
MDAQALIKKLHKQRERRVELSEGVSVIVRRPPEADIPSLRFGVTLDHLRRYVVGWEGFTEATVLGAAIGANEPVEFDAELWAEIVADRQDWILKVSNELIGAMNAHYEQKLAAAKNSEPTSTSE